MGSYKKQSYKKWKLNRITNSTNLTVLTAAEGRNSNACDVSGLCCGLGEPRDGLGEWRGETGPPGANDDVNALLDGDIGEPCPPRDPGAICNEK